jgi:hypothetical protein
VEVSSMKTEVSYTINKFLSLITFYAWHCKVYWNSSYVGLCSHCWCDCYSPILSPWLVLFSRWWFRGRFFILSQSLESVFFVIRNNCCTNDMYKIEAREQNINGILRNGFFLALVFNNQCNIIVHGFQHEFI